jgi:hypothetical protein
MQHIAKSQGFETEILLRADATRNNVINFIKTAASKLEAGDIFYLSYSGHGGQLPDISGDEPDGEDETWCLYNGQLIDDELRQLWFNFKQGVRIFVTSDSCHSGSMIKDASNRSITYSSFNPKFMDKEHALATYTKNQGFYDNLIEQTKNIKKTPILASVLLISGCQDNQYSYDGTYNGKFTRALKLVWGRGNFSGSYRDFWREISRHLPAYQSPNYLTVGQHSPNFELQRPFLVSSSFIKEVTKNLAFIKEDQTIAKSVNQQDASHRVVKTNAPIQLNVTIGTPGLAITRISQKYANGEWNNSYLFISKGNGNVPLFTLGNPLSLKGSTIRINTIVHFGTFPSSLWSQLKNALVTKYFVSGGNSNDSYYDRPDNIHTSDGEILVIDKYITFK